MRLPWTKQPEPVTAAPETPIVQLQRSVDHGGLVRYVPAAPLSVEPTLTLEPAPSVAPELPVNDIAQIARTAALAVIDEKQQQAAEKIAATVRELQRAPQVNQQYAIPGTPPTYPQSPLTPTQGAPYAVYAYDTPIDWATPMPPQRRPRSVVSLQTLRTIADTYDVLRACIQHLKRELIAVPFKWVAIEEDDDRKGTKRQIKEMEDFFCLSGGIGGPGVPRSHFECEIIEDLSIVGMAAIYYNRQFGGSFDKAIAIDAATIRPNVDYFGWYAETWKYEQWVWGVMTARYSDEDLTFTGLSTNARSWAPYYASPVEWLISSVNTAIRSDDWNRRFFTDGNTAQEKYALPETWTPDMVKAWAEYWDAMLSGDSGARQKSKWIPGGTKQIGYPSRKDQDFSQLDLWLLRRTCSIFGVQPASIGYSGEQYKVSQQDSMESTSNFGVGVLLEWFETYYGDLAKRRGCDRVKPQYIRAREEKAKERAERNQILVGAPVKTINEGRSDEGLDPVENGDDILVPNTMVPLDKLLETVTAAITSKLNPPSPASSNGPGNDGDNTDGDDTSDPAERASALTAWYRVAEAGFRANGKAAGPAGYSPNIPAGFKRSIHAALLRARSEDDVHAIFRAALTPTIYLIRHAMTEMNDEHRVRSWKDPGLSKKGKKLAKRIGRWMVGKSLTALKVSDLKRTEQTAERVSDITGAPIVDTGHAWRPWDLGDLSGRFVVDIHPIVEDYARNRPQTEVERGESLDAFLSRFLPHLGHAMDHVAAGKHAGALGIVTHGRNIKAAMAWMKAGQVNLAYCASPSAAIDMDEFLDYTVPMGGVLRMTYAYGFWTCDLIDISQEDVPDLDDLENGGLS